MSKTVQIIISILIILVVSYTTNKMLIEKTQNPELTTVLTVLLVIILELIALAYIQPFK